MEQEQNFSSVVGPLRYACQHDFAQLPRLKNLRPTLEKALRSMELERLPGMQGSALRAAIRAVDHPQLERRKHALQTVLASLHRAGVLLPPELVKLAESSPRPEEKSPRTSSDKPETKSSSRRQQRATERQPGDGARRVLSTPLKETGWRINPRLVGTLNKKGIQKVGDVLFLLPRCYEDRRQMLKIAQLRPGERGATVGTVKMATQLWAPRGGPRFRAVIADETGSIAAVYFQSGPWLKGRFPIGKRIVLSGEVRASPAGREMAHPEIESADDVDSSSIHFNRFVPIYPGLERYEQRSFRELAYRVAEAWSSRLDDPLPSEMRERLRLMPLHDAVRQLHFPLPTANLSLLNEHASDAHRRLAFDELFFLQLGLSLRRQGIKSEEGIAFQVSEERIAKACSPFTFRLTAAQLRAIREICRDMGERQPMNRLLQGDVGSGKTAVATAAAAIALFDGYQVALMAPTEILAEQHRQNVQRMLQPLGFKVELITAAGSPKARREARQNVAAGKAQVAVGTHALIQEAVEFQRLGLAIIDEQHRFGVIQRHSLITKGPRPDVLVMTATPIPRTLAMTLYGDLDVSVIDELPPGRTPITTKVFIEKQRGRAYEAMEEQLRKGHQCYVVYPLVEESEKVDLADATRGAEALRGVFPNRRVGLLHGRLKPEQKDAVMAQFRGGQLEILVCTSVVEVGVDVANASVMVIEAAERFGLSQLHQLRGRVGRGAACSYCFLLSGYARSKEAIDRLSIMERSSDGFVIAEKDLELRGPGEFLGTRQSGLPELTVANLVRDGALLSLAREEARRIVASDPGLTQPSHQGLVQALSDRWEGRLALARVG